MNHSASTRRPRTSCRSAVAIGALALVLGACGAQGPSGGSAAGGPTPASEVRSTSGQATDTGGRTTDTSTDRLGLHRPNNNPNPMVTASSDWESMNEFLWFVIDDADRYWTSILTGAGSVEPQVDVLLPMPGVAHQTACGPTDDRSMYYCPTDDTIVFSQQLAIDLWNGDYTGPDGQTIDGSGGDMAPALMVAHEFAHSIQAELGIYAKQYGVPRVEKHADCWAGVWTRNAGERGLLDPDDVQEAINTAFLVGDSSYDAPDHHGDSKQRMEAFLTGFNTTAPVDCDVYLTT